MSGPEAIPTLPFPARTSRDRGTEPTRLHRGAKRALRIVGGDSPNIEDVRNRWRIFCLASPARIRRTTEVDHGASLAAARVGSHALDVLPPALQWEARRWTSQEGDGERGPRSRQKRPT